MIAAPQPADESDRLRRVESLGTPENQGDGVLDSLVKQALLMVPGTYLAAVTLLAADTQWFKACAGLLLHHTPRSHAFCGYTILQRGPMVVEDALRDPRFDDNPLVLGPPKIRFYAGIQLKGQVGALCVVGPQPRYLTKHEADVLVSLAHFVSQRLELHRAIRELTVGPERRLAHGLL